MPDLSKVTIGIKTFLRTGKLYHALQGILRHLPECKVIVADDGEHDVGNITVWKTERKQVEFLRCPFDSGFGFKSNLIAGHLTTPYLLIASDDFEFDEQVEKGIVELVDLLDKNSFIHVAAGRVNTRRYEFYLHEIGSQIVEERVTIWGDEKYVPCDLTVNYCLVRKEVFDKVRWDDDVKIGGGEHGAWFVDLKRAGFNTVYVPGVNINEQPGKDSAEYRKFRDRAQSPDRPCFAKRGITKYVLGDGTVDYDESTTSSKKL